MIKKKWQYSKLKAFSLFFFPLLFIIILINNPIFGFSKQQFNIIGLVILMMGWWITDAVPVPVTSLLPIVILPALGISSIKNTTIPYASPAVFLYMGGFILAIAIEKWNLHMRIALGVVRLIGTNANGIIGGFIAATCLLSMWMSNTATVVMMMPICLAVITLLKNANTDLLQNDKYNNFSTSIMLSIAFGSSIGGIGTIIGTPSNTIFSNYMFETYNYEIGFMRWMIIGVIFMIIMACVCWISVIKIYPNNLGSLEEVKHIINKEFSNLGKMSKEEKLVSVVFILTAFLWGFRIKINTIFPSLNLTDEAISLISAISLFLIPINLKAGKFLLDWKTAEKLPWGVLLLFGGGLTIAEVVEKSGIVTKLESAFTGDLSNIALIALSTLIAVFITQFMSNMALITILLPVLTSASLAYAINPLLITIPATIGVSCAFCLPIATPPNALIFASGYVKIPQMLKVGSVIAIISFAVIVLMTRYLVPVIFGFDVLEFPEWAKYN